jgi:hypothetical protein
MLDKNAILDAKAKCLSQDLTLAGQDAAKILAKEIEM